MCRSIKTLPRGEGLATDQEIYEAALQFVRKVSGYRVPSQANQGVFDLAVREISAASRQLLDSLPVKSLTVERAKGHPSRPGDARTRERGPESLPRL